jgi:aryl-alcohol dehydrogenase-like predicted oxidoreductase
MIVETTEMAPGYRISRMLRGGWQLSGGHGAVDRERAIADMAAFLDAGIVAFDCADHYTGVEEMIGAFRARILAERGAEALRGFKVHTKFVPDFDDLATTDCAYVARIIDRSLHRLGSERLDLVQFHWWSYDVPRFVEVAQLLAEQQKAGKIDLIGGTNFDTPRTVQMLGAGVPLATMQVQYSLLDRRPESALAPFAARSGMQLLCYGALAGGFFSKTWLGAPDPEGNITNRSLIKYRLIIEEFGGWPLFQKLLATLDSIAAKHATTIPVIATRWVLDRPQVAGVIVGARYAAHLPENLAVFAVRLDDADRRAIDTVAAERRGPRGDVYALERDKDGPHGRIMRYNLNKV